MIVSTSHAEEELLGLLKDIGRSGADDYYLVTFKDTGHTYASPWDIVLLQTIVNNTHKILEDAEDVRAFFCHDGELVVVLKDDVSGGSSEKISHMLRDILGSGEVRHHELSEIYEKVLADCEKKHEKWIGHQELEPKRKKSSHKVKVDKKYAKEILEKRQSREGMHILLVEDEPFTLKLIEGVLERYTIIKAMTGQEAVEAYMLNAPDMVFLDINLPGMDGHEVLKQILAFDEDAYVVMLSGNTLMKDVSYSLSKGAKGFVVKPFPKEKLLNYVGLCKTIKEEKSLLNEAV